MTFATLMLLQIQRLKACFLTAQGSSGHHLLISAFMFALKVICDDTYSNSPGPLLCRECSNCARSTRWRERDVPVPRVGAQHRSCHATGVQRDDPQGFHRSQPLSYVHPPVDQEDNAPTHCQSLRSTVKYKSIAVICAAVSITTQIHIPSSPKSSCCLNYSPHYPRHTLFFVLSLDVPSIISLPTHPSWH